MKQEIVSQKLETNTKSSNTKLYDLEDRLLNFAKDVRRFVESLPKTLITQEDGKQLIRSSGSVGANYLEANESLSKKDFLMRIKIAKKEARETVWWLELIKTDENLSKNRLLLMQESIEIMKILGAILRNSQ